MNEIGLREARKEIGPIADRARYTGEITYLTRNGERIAAIVPLDRIKETAVTEPTTYTAAIGLTRSVVAGDNCDLTVAENDIVGYREDEDGNEIPVYEMGTDPIFVTETTVRTDADDKAGAVLAAADEVLAERGWRRVGDWDDASGDAAYATVERA